MPTQQALADRAGVGRRTVVAVEAGDKVSSLTLRKIELALELDTGSIDAFLVGRIHSLDEVASVEREAPELRDDVERQLWDLDLPEADRLWFIQAHRLRGMPPPSSEPGGNTRTA